MPASNDLPGTGPPPHDPTKPGPVQNPLPPPPPGVPAVNQRLYGDDYPNPTDKHIEDFQKRNGMPPRKASKAEGVKEGSKP